MKIRIGTRGSKLATTQTHLVAAAIEGLNPEYRCEIVEITTQGDKKQGTPLAAVSDKKEWVYELELALLEGRIDVAVHSAKDLPAQLESGTSATSVLRRAIPFDVLIGKDPAFDTSVKALPEAALIGTASLRRKASLLHLRSDLRVTDHRGNVPTRLQKLEEHPEMHGIILAAAGLERLALLKSHHTLLSPAEMLPAMNQGILAAQFVAPEVGAICYQIAHSDTQSAFLTERHCSEQLGADCRSALGIFATTTPNQISLEVAIFSPDGTQVLRAARHAPRGEEEKLADKLANDLLMQGASALLAIGTPGKTKP